MIFLIEVRAQPREQRTPMTLPGVSLLLGASFRGMHSKPDSIHHFRIVVGHVLALKPDPLRKYRCKGGAEAGWGSPWHVGHAGEAKPNCVTDWRQP